MGAGTPHEFLKLCGSYKFSIDLDESREDAQ
jgi:hypothetical protein